MHAHPNPKAASDPKLEFALVYREYLPFVWRCLRRLGVSEGDVEDVCQETFVIAHRKLAHFDGSSSVRTWLFGIVLRKASEYRRYKRVRPERPVAELPEQLSPPPQPLLVEQKQARALLDDVLAELDAPKRAVFILYELEQLPMTEVAALVECPLQTAYSRLHAARKSVQAAVHRLQSKERFR